MVCRRAEACWRMLTEPEHTRMSDVAAVFFEDCRDRHFTGELDTPTALVAQLGEGMGDCESPSVARVFELAEQRRAERAAAAAPPLGQLWIRALYRIIMLRKCSWEAVLSDVRLLRVMRSAFACGACWLDTGSQIRQQRLHAQFLF